MLSRNKRSHEHGPDRPSALQVRGPHPREEVGSGGIPRACGSVVVGLYACGFGMWFDAGFVQVRRASHAYDPGDGDGLVPLFEEDGGHAAGRQEESGVTQGCGQGEEVRQPGECHAHVAHQHHFQSFPSMLWPFLADSVDGSFPFESQSFQELVSVAAQGTVSILVLGVSRHDVPGFLRRVSHPHPSALTFLCDPVPLHPSLVHAPVSHIPIRCRVPRCAWLCAPILRRRPTPHRFLPLRHLPFLPAPSIRSVPSPKVPRARSYRSHRRWSVRSARRVPSARCRFDPLRIRWDASSTGPVLLLLHVLDR
eukprot:scaffold301_cov370-Pavlova_lutheri.AAC.16